MSIVSAPTLADFSQRARDVRRPARSPISIFSCAAIALAAITISTPASAKREGIAGYSGKGGGSCNTCHNGGTAPNVTLTGPTTLAAGTTGQYRLRVETGLAAVGMGASATTGVKLTPGTNQKLLGTEITQTAPVAPTNGAVEFTFSVEAPATNGPITVYAAGNATNQDDTPDGDLAALTTMEITVTGGAAPGTATDAGAATGASGTDSGATPAGTPSIASSAADAGTPFYLRGADPSDRPEFADTGFSCSAGSIGASLARDGTALAFGIVTAIALSRRRRRRRN